MEHDVETMGAVQEVLTSDPGPKPPEPFREVSPLPRHTGDIPISRYVSREYHELEMQRLWPRVWQWAACEEDLPDPGNYTVYEIGRYSILIVRGADGEVRAFHNSCMHRGTMLMDGTGGCAQIRCPFHAWTWYLDGSVKDIPSRWDFPQATDERAHLREVKVELWRGLIFINMDPAAAALGDHLDVLPRHFASVPLESLRTVVEISKVMPANWKVVMDAFLESYHVVGTHPSALEWTSDVATQYDAWRTVNKSHTVNGVASDHLGPDYDAEATFESALPFFASASLGVDQDTVPSLPEGMSPREMLAQLQREAFLRKGRDYTDVSTSELLDSVYFLVFPNWCPWSRVTSGMHYRFRPNGDDHETSIMDVRILTPPREGASRSYPPRVIKLGVDQPFSDAGFLSLTAILDQDLGNIPRVQRGMMAREDGGLMLGVYQESRIRHYQQLLDTWVGA